MTDLSKLKLFRIISISSFILHPSSFILYPSSFILHSSLIPKRKAVLNLL